MVNIGYIEQLTLNFKKLNYMKAFRNNDHWGLFCFIYLYFIIIIHCENWSQLTILKKILIKSKSSQKKSMKILWSYPWDSSVKSLATNGNLKITLVFTCVAPRPYKQIYGFSNDRSWYWTYSLTLNNYKTSIKLIK